MRTILPSLAVLIFISLLLCTGCNKDSNPADNNPSNNLVGTWDLTSMTTGGQPTTLADMGLQSLVLTIRADASYTVVLTHLAGNADTQNGTYTTSGSQITLTDSTGLVTSGTYALSGNTVTFTLTNNQLGNYTQTFIRQNIELFGAWTGTDNNSGSGPVQFTITFTNTTITWNYGGSPMSGDILAYNNSANSVVFRWTNHPAFTGKYQKFIWLSEPGATVTVQAYSVEATQDAAANSTNASYTPITMTKQ